MSARNSGDIKAALLKKGFKESNADHKKYIYIYNGRCTTIMTKVSHGHKEYDDYLLKQIKKQMHLDSIEDLLAFIDCTFTKENYLKLLKRKKLL